MKVIATKVKAEELKPGDLFSTMGQRYWNTAARGDGEASVRRGLYSVGESVYIRTDTPCPKEQADNEVYRITIERGDAE